MEPNVYCELEHCKFCIKTAHRNREDGTSVDYYDECIDCEEGWRTDDETRGCEEDKPEQPPMPEGEGE